LLGERDDGQQDERRGARQHNKYRPQVAAGHQARVHSADCYHDADGEHRRDSTEWTAWRVRIGGFVVIHAFESRVK
jgi:hypothetical protein